MDLRFLLLARLPPLERHLAAFAGSEQLAGNLVLLLLTTSIVFKHQLVKAEVIDHLLSSRGILFYLSQAVVHVFEVLDHLWCDRRRRAAVDSLMPGMMVLLIGMS